MTPLLVVLEREAEGDAAVLPSEEVEVGVVVAEVGDGRLRHHASEFYTQLL